MKAYKIRIAYWYWDTFEVDAETEEEALELVLDDTVKYCIDDEEQMGQLHDQKPEITEVAPGGAVCLNAG